LRPLQRRFRPWQTLLQGLLALGLAVLLAQQIVTAAEHHQRSGQSQIAADGLAMLWAPSVLALAGMGRTLQAVVQILAQALGLLGRRRAPLPSPPPSVASPSQSPPPVSPLREEYRHACAALGVAPGSSWAVIRAAWRRQLPQWHPDHGGDLELWHQRQSAYRLLAELKR
jgi:hypothetical protein